MIIDASKETPNTRDDASWKDLSDWQQKVCELRDLHCCLSRLRLRCRRWHAARREATGAAGPGGD